MPLKKINLDDKQFASCFHSGWIMLYNSTYNAVSYQRANLQSHLDTHLISAGLCSTLFTLLCWSQFRWIIFVLRPYRWEVSWIVHEACEGFFSCFLHFFLRPCLICAVYFSCICKVSLIFLWIGCRLTVHAECPMHLEDFPMDFHSCPLKFGSCE